MPLAFIFMIVPIKLVCFKYTSPHLFFMSLSLSSIAFIPDGNRRYAKKAGIPLLSAYQQGTNKAWQVFDWLQAYPEIKTGTFYTLSLENLTRQKNELGVLYSIFEKELNKVISEELLDSFDARFQVIGKTEALPHHLRELIAKAEKKSAHHTKRTLNLAIGYNGQTEIVDAAKKIAKDVESGKLNPDRLDEKSFAHYLYADFAAPDLIVRTSGTKRLSGFLSYQSAYSELYFCDKYWPEFNQGDLGLAINDYYDRDRRFGK